MIRTFAGILGVFLVFIIIFCLAGIAVMQLT